jgi:hypothetical protein
VCRVNIKKLTHMAERLTINVQTGGVDADARAFSAAFVDILDLLDAIAQEMPGGGVCVTWNIVSLQKHSPAEIVLESNSTKKLARSLISGLSAIQSLGKKPFGLRAMKIARRLGDRIGADEIHTLQLSCDRKVFVPTADLAANARDLIDRGFYELPSSVDGTLEIVNVHGDPMFSIFDDVSRREIKCRFPSEMFDRVKAGLKKRITAIGVVRFNSATDRPVSIKIESIEELEEAESTPFLEQMPPIEITGGDTSSEEYVKGLRNAR